MVAGEEFNGGYIAIVIIRDGANLEIHGSEETRPIGWQSDLHHRRPVCRALLQRDIDWARNSRCAAVIRSLCRQDIVAWSGIAPGEEERACAWKRTIRERRIHNHPIRNNAQA